MRGAILVACLMALSIAVPGYGQVPGGVELTCDADRKEFRNLAKLATNMTFRLWDAEIGGTQCGSDHVILMSEVAALRAKTDRFDSEKPRRFEKIRVVLGDDATPFELCSGAASWLDVTVGTTTLTCDFSAKIPLRRRRLRSSSFSARSGEGAVGATVMPTAAVEIANGITGGVAVPFDSELWDTAGLHDNVTNNTRLTAPSDGTYLITAHVEWESDSFGGSGFREAAIRMNATGENLAVSTDVPVVGQQPQQSLTTIFQLSAGDFVELYVQQNSGEPLDVLVHPSAPSSGSLGMVKLQ